MRLEKASAKAIKYAIMKWHYSKSVPMCQSSFAVFNKSGVFCGVICYAIGANNNIAKPYNLKQGEVIELVRVALNGKQESTSKAMAISLQLVKKINPLVKLVVSYADEGQNHKGTIYQATNWYFTGDTFQRKVEIDGKVIHSKTVYSKYGCNGVDELKKKGISAKLVKDKPKHKYIYPLDKSMVDMCKALSKPYPKALEAEETRRSASSTEKGGSSPTLTL